MGFVAALRVTDVYMIQESFAESCGKVERVVDKAHQAVESGSGNVEKGLSFGDRVCWGFGNVERVDKG
jgi:hypothetical protein